MASQETWGDVMTKIELCDFQGTSAKLGGKSRITIWRWVRQGILPPPMKINSRNYWHTAELDEAIKRLAEDSKTTN